MKYILSIDQSTSATKVLLFDMSGQCLDRESKEHEQIYLQPGWVEHDLDKIWSNLLTVVKTLVSRHVEKIKSFSHVSITNQRETIGAFERKSGKPIGNAIVWQCRRGSEICRELEESGCGSRVSELTGLRLDTYFSASKLKWIQENETDLSAKLSSGEAVVGTVDTYLIHRLTNGQVFATDHTNASRTLLYDIGRLRWDEWLCELFKVPIIALPEVRESSAYFGETTFDGLLSSALPICGVMGDSQASLFAHQCYSPGSTKITFGTGSSALLNIGNSLRFSKTGSVSTIAWVWKGQPTYSFEGIINFSAASISWLKDQLGLLKSSSEASELAMAVPDNGGVYMVPAFAGLSAPHWKPNARAAIVGLTAHSTRNHIVRAAEESIAYQLSDILEMMNQEAGVEVKHICADGGPTRDSFLMQFTADIIGSELQVATQPDLSALGAAMSGMLGRGHYNNLEDLAALKQESKIYHPGMDKEAVRPLIQAWKTAVRRVF